MKRLITRRRFAKDSAALSLASVVPAGLFGQSDGARQIEVRADDKIGEVRPALHGQFAEHLGSCVYGGLWVGKSSPIPNVNGYRKAAVDYLKELGVPVLRWPGGCFADDYHWREGIGAPEKRPKRVNIHWGGYVEDNSFGTHEFIGLCRLIGAEPYLAGNVGSGSPREMRDWVEYCNQPSGSTLAEERAANGSPEPFQVRLWGVGNESWGCGGQMTPDEYAAYFRRFSVFLREFGGTHLFLIASGPNNTTVAWTRGLMAGLVRHRPADGVSMHYYSWARQEPTKFDVDHMNEQLSSFAKIEQAVIQQRALLDGYDRGKNVGLIVDEWGVWDRGIPDEEKNYGRLWQQSTMRSAVAAGLGLNLFNRQADKLYMCNIAQMVNVLQSMLLTDGPAGRNCIRTTSYYAFLLFKPHRGKMAVPVEAADNGPLGLSASATLGEGELNLSLVNPRHDQDMDVVCSVRGGKPSSATAQILHDADWNACNTFDQPDRVKPGSHPVAVDNGKVRIGLPPLSLLTAIIKLG